MSLACASAGIRYGLGMKKNTTSVVPRCFMRKHADFKPRLLAQSSPRQCPAVEATAPAHIPGGRSKDGE